MPALRITLALLLAALVLAPVPARACNIPVFRYALDRWPSDPYRLTVFHRGPLAAEHRDALKALEKHADDDHPSVVLELVDLAKNADGAAGVPIPKADAELPYLVVQYPAATRINVPIWSGALKPDVAAALLDSPTRRELARRILNGDSAVWVLLASGDAAKDDAAEKLLRAEVQKLEKELKLPVLTAAPDDKLRDDRPLKLAFSVLRVGRKDPAEDMLVRMLLNTEDDLPGRSDPMVFPAFGRGRVMPALVGAGITRENIREAAAFLVGPCSCELKRDNPGVDLLLTTDWGKAPATTSAPPVPPGTTVPIPRGVPVFEASTIRAPETGAREVVPPEATSAPTSHRRLILAGIGITGGIAVFTGVMLLRARWRVPQ